MGEYRHSVELVEDMCIGCTDCIKRCPTEAIRVREGKAHIKSQKCIDCGLCVIVCSHKAKRAITQKMSIIKQYKYKIAIPAPALYSQFENITDVNRILTAVKQLGFDDVFEVSLAAQVITEATKKYMMDQDVKKPIISSACPVIIRLICMRFPSLIDNILPIIAPVEVAAIEAKNYMEKQGMNREDIGVFFISPCAAKNTYATNPLGLEKSEIDVVISIQDIYMALRHQIQNIETVEKFIQSDIKGVDWAISGGEIRGIDIENSIAVDGVENVIKVLEEVENGQLEDLDFIEGVACIGGCVGGPLTVVNSFVAKNRLLKVQKSIKQMDPSEKRPEIFTYNDINFRFTKEIEEVPAMLLDEDMGIALEKMERIRSICEELPCIDCGSCGSPTCQALAEDIVRDEANVEDCIFMLRKKVKQLAESMVDLSAKMPQTMGNVNKK